MKILGISSWFHDSSACLLINGKVISYVEEERFNRIKHTHDYPQMSVEWVLKEGGIELDDLDEVVYYLNPFKYFKIGIKTALSQFPASLSLASKNAATFPPLLRVWNILNLKKIMCQAHDASGNFKIRNLNHYLTHQASAFYASGFDDSAILTMDFAGDGSTEVIALGKDKRITDILSHKIPHGFALVYTTVTHLLGFKWWDEYKVMGMAAYGKPIYQEQIEKLFSFNDETGQMNLNLDFFEFHKFGRHRLFSKEATKLLGPVREYNSEITQREYDLAASLQSATTKYGLAMAKLAKEKTGSTNLCLAGGVAQNCLMNQTICESGLFDNVFLQPLASDIGCTLGAALYSYHHIHNNPRLYTMDNLYLGPSYKNESLKAAKNRTLKERKSDDWHYEVARSISEGLVIGYYDGRMEVGPRALGSRSIMADARRDDMKEILNSRVKHREHFRPFAPSVLADKKDMVFEPLRACRSLEYMIVTQNVRPEWQLKVPAIVHDDGTSRIQAVNKEHAPNYYKIIENFYEITGVPLVINTSFNDNEPIVCTPEDAINCFLRTRIDLLVLDSKLYYRDDNMHVAQKETVAM